MKTEFKQKTVIEELTITLDSKEVEILNCCMTALYACRNPHLAQFINSMIPNIERSKSCCTGELKPMSNIMYKILVYDKLEANLRYVATTLAAFNPPLVKHIEKSVDEWMAKTKKIPASSPVCVFETNDKTLADDIHRCFEIRGINSIVSECVKLKYKTSKLLQKKAKSLTNLGKYTSKKKDVL